MFDIIIKNGTIIDGTGVPGFVADIGIKDDKIAKIGELDNEKADREIEAAGFLICPGFVDVNNHSDTYWQMFLNPDLESLVYQGITTIIGGNCGSSLAPLTRADSIESIQKWADLRRVNVNWLNMKEFLKVMESKTFPVNFATLVGHSTLRRGILKDEARSLNPQELNYIQKILADSLKSGALGMSTGLVYTHAKLASTEELANLAKTVKKYDGVYATHVRGEKEELIEAVEEAVKIAQASGVKLHISHLKAMGEKNWPKMEEALGLIEKAREMGLDVTFDVYPYTNTGSVLYVMLPDWVAEGGKKAMVHRLKDPVIRAKVIDEMKNSDFDYGQIEIAISPLDKTLTRRRITEIAASQEKSVEEAVIDILITSDGRVITSMEILSEDNVKKAIAHPLAMISTNGAGYNLEHSASGEMVHPRSFGTTLKIFSRYVIGEEILTWEEAVRKMTALPADKFGIKNRGKIKEKYFADVVVLDKDKIRSLATKNNPYQYCSGVEFSLVNGQLTIDQGKYIKERNGKVIRRS